MSELVKRLRMDHLLDPASAVVRHEAADRIEALSPDRAALWERVTKAPFLTVNEKRAATGYGAVQGGDTFTAG